MYSLQDDEITLEEIYNKIPEYNLWTYYCSNFKSLNSSFRSDLYNDKNPSCRLIQRKNGSLYYRDFGSGEYYSDIISYLKVKYNCNFKECLNIIANDFNIRKTSININKNVKNVNFDEIFLIKPKVTINVEEQPFTLDDYCYWNRFKLPLDFIYRNDIVPCGTITVYNGDNAYKRISKRNKPIYAYKEYDIDLNYLGYRIYSPLSSKYEKWLSNSDNYRVIQGIKGLKDTGDLLIITKSLKDVLVLRYLGYNAISLGSETTVLTKEIYEKLTKRFKNIISLYDNDEIGIKYSQIMLQNHGIKPILIPMKYNCKDISSVVEQHGLEVAKKLLKDLING